jgi:hypothetical protein
MCALTRPGGDRKNDSPAAGPLSKVRSDTSADPRPKVHQTSKSLSLVSRSKVSETCPSPRATTYMSLGVPGGASFWRSRVAFHDPRAESLPTGRPARRARRASSAFSFFSRALRPMDGPSILDASKACHVGWLSLRWLATRARLRQSAAVSAPTRRGDAMPVHHDSSSQLGRSIAVSGTPNRSRST